MTDYSDLDPSWRPKQRAVPTEEDEDEIRRLIGTGMRIATIARATRFGEAAIRRVRDLQDGAITTYVSSAWSPAQIEKHLGFSHAALQSTLKRLGLSTDEPRQIKLFLLVDMGMSDVEIAESMDMKVGKVERLRRERQRARNARNLPDRFGARV